MTTETSTVRKAGRLPRYKRAETAPKMVLTQRDEDIIRWVYELRFATQEQIQQVLFSPSTASSCKRRLTLLYHNGYLDRRLLPLRSRFGANRAAYCLDKKGKELLLQRQGSGLAQIDWRPADNDRELYFLEHLLAANQVRVCATLAASEQGFNLSWVDERALKTVSMKEQVKDPKNPERMLAVVPALELDRATVEEKPFKVKIRALGEWKVTGAYKRRFRTDSLRVLFVVGEQTRDPKRLQRIKAWTEAEGGRSLFWFAELTNITPASIFNQPIWQVAGRDGRFMLFA
jgi:hypothetical protein